MRMHLRWRWGFAVLECMHARSLQSCPTLCNPMDCSPPGSSVWMILQARILEWVAMLSSRGSSWPRDWTHVSYVACISRQVLYPSTTWEAPCSGCSVWFPPISTQHPWHSLGKYQHWIDLEVEFWAANRNGKGGNWQESDWSDRL